MTLKNCQLKEKNNSVFCTVKDRWVSPVLCQHCYEWDQAQHPEAYKKKAK